MFEAFSSRYLLGHFHAYPEDRPRAAMNRTAYEMALDYVAGPPMVLKLENRHFAVYGDETVPYGELAIPVSILQSLSLDVGFEPEPTTVLVARDEEVGRLAGI